MDILTLAIAKSKSGSPNGAITTENITNALGYKPADQEEVDKLSEEIAEIKPIPYELRENLFYANYDSIKNKVLTTKMNSNGNATFNIINNDNAGIYYNGVNLESGSYVVFVEMKLNEIHVANGSTPKVKLSIVDGWTTRTDGKLVTLDTESETVFLYDVIEFPNKNNIKNTLSIVFDSGYEPNSSVSLEIIKMGILNADSGVDMSIIRHYEMQKMYPVFIFSDDVAKLNVFNQAYIKNCELVANQIKQDNPNVAQYTVAKMSNKIKTIKAKVKFYGDACGAIISQNNGMNSVYNVTDKSIHITFTKNSVAIGYFNERVGTEVIRKEYELIEGEEYTIGFTISNGVLTVHLPNGEDFEVDDSNNLFESCNGAYAVWEHYNNIQNKEFSSVHFTKFWAEDIDGNILCDDFKRLDGAIGNAPTGQVYGQFTSLNQNGWDF